MWGAVIILLFLGATVAVPRAPTALKLIDSAQHLEEDITLYDSERASSELRENDVREFCTKCCTFDKGITGNWTNKDDGVVGLGHGVRFVGTIAQSLWKKSGYFYQSQDHGSNSDDVDNKAHQVATAESEGSTGEQGEESGVPSQPEGFQKLLSCKTKGAFSRWADYTTEADCKAKCSHLTQKHIDVASEVKQIDHCGLGKWSMNYKSLVKGEHVRGCNNGELEEHKPNPKDEQTKDEQNHNDAQESDDWEDSDKDATRTGSHNLQHYKMLAIEASMGSYSADPAVDQILNQVYDTNGALMKPLCQQTVAHKTLVYNEQSDTHAAFYVVGEGKDKICLISFRGTDVGGNFQDLVSNTANMWAKHIDCEGKPHQIQVKKKSKDAETCYVGWGFLRAYLSVQKELQDFNSKHKCGETAMTLVTGHSLGGALATVAAFDLALSSPNVHSITFGSPRVGGPRFKKVYNQNVKDTIRYVERYGEPGTSYGVVGQISTGGTDWVSVVPLASMGYEHVVARTVIECEAAISTHRGPSDHLANCHMQYMYGGSLENSCQKGTVHSPQKLCPGLASTPLCEDVIAPERLQIDMTKKVNELTMAQELMAQELMKTRQLVETLLSKKKVKEGKED